MLWFCRRWMAMSINSLISIFLYLSCRFLPRVGSLYFTYGGKHLSVDASWFCSLPNLMNGGIKKYLALDDLDECDEYFCYSPCRRRERLMRRDCGWVRLDGGFLVSIVSKYCDWQEWMIFLVISILCFWNSIFWNFLW